MNCIRYNWDLTFLTYSRKVFTTELWIRKQVILLSHVNKLWSTPSIWEMVTGGYKRIRQQAGKTWKRIFDIVLVVNCFHQRLPQMECAFSWWNNVIAGFVDFCRGWNPECEFVVNSQRKVVLKVLRLRGSTVTVLLDYQMHAGKSTS